METLDCIKTRRSIRKFSDKEVASDLIEKIIEAGKCAPSSMDCQPWQFYIVKDRGMKEKLAKLGHDENKQMVLACNFVLIISVDKEKSPSRFIEDGVLASQNMSLAIHDLGLGSVYLSAYKPNESAKTEAIQKMFSIPDKNMPICMLLVGYPDRDEKLAEKKLKDNKDIIEYR